MTNHFPQPRRFSRRDVPRPEPARWSSRSARRGCSNPKAAFAALEDDFPIGPALVDPNADRLVARDRRRRHGHDQDRQGRARHGHHDGDDAARRRRARRAARARSRSIQSTRGRRADQGFTAGSQSNETRERHRAASARRAAEARARAADDGVGAARRSRSSQLDASRTASSASAAARAGLLRELIGGKLFNLKIRPARRCRSRTAPTRSSARRAADRHPGKVIGKFTYTQDVRRRREWCTRASCGRRRSTRRSSSVDGFPGGKRPASDQGRRQEATSSPSSPSARGRRSRPPSALKVTWNAAPLPNYDDVLRRSAEPTTADDRTACSIDTQRRRRGARRARRRQLEATYTYPIQMHGSMGASAATAWVDGQTATVWSLTQGVYPLRGAARDRARHPGAEHPRHLRRGLRLLRPQRRRQRRARRRGDLAGGRQAGARAVHARGRAQVGELRPAVPCIEHARRRSTPRGKVECRLGLRRLDGRPAAAAPARRRTCRPGS